MEGVRDARSISLKRSSSVLKLCMVSNFEQDIPLQELTSPVVLLVRSKQRSGSCDVTSTSAVAMDVPVETRERK